MNDAYDTRYTYYYNPKDNVYVVPDNTYVPATQWVAQKGYAVFEDEDGVFAERDFLKEKLENVLDFLVDSGMSRDDVIDHFGLEDYYVK